MRKNKLFGLRISEELRAFVKNQAVVNGRSQNRQIEYWIQQEMNKQEEKCRA